MAPQFVLLSHASSLLSLPSRRRSPLRLATDSRATMSGLEGIAALGLACNVLQLIGTVATSITVARNILKSGTINSAFEGRNDELTKVFQDVQGSLSQVPAREVDEELRNVAEHTLKTTAELKAELAEILGSPLQGKTRRVIGGTIRAFLSQQKLDKLEEKVLTYQKAFELRLLLSLRYICPYPLEHLCMGKPVNAVTVGVESTSAHSSKKMTSPDLTTLCKNSSRAYRIATRNLRIFSIINRVLFR